MEEIYCDEIIINSMMLTKVSSENMAKDLHKNNVAILWRDTKNQIGRGSGILISKNLVLTCAHNLYWLGQRVNNNLFSIYPGLDGKLERAYKIEACYIPEEYPKAPKNKNIEYDYALIKLTEMVPSNNFLPLSGVFTNIGQKLAIYGYPLAAYRNTGYE